MRITLEGKEAGRSSLNPGVGGVVPAWPCSCLWDPQLCSELQGQSLRLQRVGRTLRALLEGFSKHDTIQNFSQLVARPIQKLAWHWWQKTGEVVFLYVWKGKHQKVCKFFSSPIFLTQRSQINFKL